MLYGAFRPSNVNLFPQFTRYGRLSQDFGKVANIAIKLKGQVRDLHGKVVLDYWLSAANVKDLK